MNSRQRVLTALDHQQPDRLPLELGGAGITLRFPATQKRLRQAWA